MLKHRGIAFKLVFLILISDAAILAFIFGYNYRVSRQIIEKNIRDNARNLVMATVNRIDTLLLPVEKVPQNLACFLENSPPSTEEEMKDLLRAIVEKNRDIYGAAIAFEEPHALGIDRQCLAPYWCKSGDGMRFTCLSCDSYKYFLWDWYRIPKEVRHPVWSEPYFDRGGGDILMATYSVPFFKMDAGERRFMGVITADISLSWLTEIVSSIKVAESGYGFLISTKGKFLTHPQTELIMNKTIFDAARTRDDPDLQKIGTAMTEGKTGFAPFTSMVTGKRCWIAYAPLASSDWSLGVLFPQDELAADITRLNHVVWALGIVGFLLLLAVIIMIARSITRPLRGLAKATEGIAAGNLNVVLPPIRSRDEVGVLTDAFARMEKSLDQYIRDLTETTAQKERIESELQVARDIQMGMLPKAFPRFPGIAPCDIYADLKPARQVGGDLYDFFSVDDDHLCFTIGDVAGKGVPAALFMTVIQTLNKTKATQGRSSGDIVASVNKDLSLENPSFMFVTLFVGILNIHTGELEFCNGGHDPPYMIRANDTIEAMELTDGLALGIERDFPYRSKKTWLRTGDTVFLYTDGVTEAMNQKKELFTQKRLEEGLCALRDRPLDQMAAGIMERIEAFSQGEPQADDITMLILRFHGDGR